MYNLFSNLYHLVGGIIHYNRIAKVHGLPIKFIGKNFVFDERLGERITEDVIAKCHQFGKPADAHTNFKNEAFHLLFISLFIYSIPTNNKYIKRLTYLHRF